jgi:hypothetical protein
MSDFEGENCENRVTTGCWGQNGWELGVRLRVKMAELKIEIEGKNE